MLRGLRGSVRGVRFRSNRREIAFFAPARACRLRAVMERGSSGAARCGAHWVAKFVKFVHFHSAISLSLPQLVSGRGRWGGAGSGRVPIRPTGMPVRSASALRNPPHGRSVPQYARAGRTSRAILPASQMRPPYAAHGPPMGDAPPFVRADRRSVLQRNGTPKNALKLRDQHRQREQRKAPVPLCDGMVRRCENYGDTGGSVEAFVEAWPTLSPTG
jgi:hypothetical protein